MKGQLGKSAGTEARIVPLEQPEVMRVRRRHETHWLALVSTAAVLFVAVSVAKPWGGTAAPRHASTPAASVVVAQALHTIDPAVVDLSPGNGELSTGNGDFSWTCAETGGPLDGSSLPTRVGPSSDTSIVEYRWVENGGPATQPFPTVPPQADPSASPSVSLLMGGGLTIMPPIADPSASAGTCSQWVIVEPVAASTP